jgi:signal transduction histidine kinase
MLNAMLVPHPDGISPELLERASALLSTREPHFPLSLDRIDDVRRASQYVREYAALSGDARSAAASRCVHNLRILLDKFPRAAGIGCIRKTMAAAIAGWLRWVEMDMEVWNPIALLEDFRKTLAGGTNQRDAYERARIQLLQRLHWALGAEESRLYVFTEDAETSTVVMGSDALPLTSRGTADVRAVRRFVEEQTSDEHPDAGGHPLLGSGVRSGDFAVQTMPLYRAGFLDHAYVFLLKRTRDDPEKMIHPLRFLPLLLEADFLVAQRLTMQSAMVRAAAHQLRTPLHTLRGYMSALFGGHVKASAVVERYRATLEATGEYLSRIVEGIVVSERLSREALPLRKADYDLAEDAAACAQMMRYVWRRNDQELQVILPKDPLIVHADRDRIRDVLVVLLDNACKYSPAASPVVLTFESTKRIAVLIVEDHGLGIPAEEISHIFELGYIGPTARQLNYDGSGLGLFIARSYVEAHGGVIGARSAGRRGMGTAFTVKLPRPASIPRRKG